MHGRTITMDTWAEIHEELELPSYGTVGAAAITTGEHPFLGAVTAIQSLDGIFVVTELPFNDRIDRQIAEREDEFRAIVAAATSRKRRSAKAVA